MSPSIFDFKGADVRVSSEGEAIWFVASDVAAVLEIQNVRQNLAAFPENERGVYTVDTPGGPQNVACVNEAGLYRLIFQSRKPKAEDFKTWVFSEVLPAIRRDGSYNAQSALRFRIPATYAEALQLAADQALQLEAKDAQLAEAAPKLVTYDRVMSSDSLFGFREVAAMLAQKGIGSTNLVRRLEAMGILYHEKRGDKKGHVMAKAEFIHRGYFKMIERAYEVREVGGAGTGEHRVSATLKVTALGVEFIARKMEGRPE